MDLQITEALSLRSDKSSKILHIGCGTSLLSFHLRAHVDDLARIHNVDFSAKAIEWDVQNEKAIFHKEEEATHRRQETIRTRNAGSTRTT